MAYPTIKQGSRVPEVKTWQKIIGVTADGIFGPATATATKKWQKDHGLVADGIVGPKTWEAATKTQAPVKPPVGKSDTANKAAVLSSFTSTQAAPTFTPTPVLSAAPSSFPTLKKGSKVPEVKVWQSIIGVKADGIFGPATETATKKWQKDRGLTADGVVGPKTWAAAFPTASPVNQPVFKPTPAPAAPTFVTPKPTAFTPVVAVKPPPAKKAAPVKAPKSIFKETASVQQPAEQSVLIEEVVTPEEKKANILNWIKLIGGGAVVGTLAIFGIRKLRVRV